MKLPQPRKIIAEKYVAGLSLFKSRRSPIKLSANESALGPSPKAVKSYSSVRKGFVRYPDSDGTYFRKVLAKKFKLKRDRIILGSGSDQIFELVCKLFLNKGAKLIANRTEFYVALTALILGVQLFLAGFLGEMIARNSPKRNVYKISHKSNLDE